VSLPHDAAGPWLRRAGRLATGGGETVLWSVAEGRRGRRWRSLRLAADGQVVTDLLIEVDAAGAWVRLELGSASGLLTLHPQPGGGAVHGNAVTPDGMRHHAFAWGSDHRLVVEGDAVAVCALAAGSPSGAGPGLLVARDLEVVARASLVAPRPARPDGLPGPSWPLEVDAATAGGSPGG
jgi:hypothetical protein